MRGSMSLKRLLLRFAVIVALLYLLACIALYTMQRSLLYFPQPMLAAPDAQTISIPSGSKTLQGWVVNPGQPHALMYFGGKGERVERDVDFFRSTLPGYSVYLVPYRGYGPNEGEPTEAGLYADALVEYAWVRARSAHVAAMGRSLGTGVATYVASTREVEMLVLVTPYDSVLNIARSRYPMFPVSLILKDRYESWRRAGSIKARALVVLASDDQAVPRSNSDVLIYHFRPKPDVIVIPHSGHNNLSNSAVYAHAIADFMRVSTVVKAAALPATPSPQH